MQIRRTTAADVMALAELRWEFQFDPTAPISMQKAAFLDQCAAFFNNSLQENWLHWIAEMDEHIVAMISMQLIPTLPRPEKMTNYFGYLTNFYTKPAYRGRGIGKHLLQAAQNWAITHNLELLIVWSSEEAVEYYKKRGFIINPELMEFLIEQ